MTMRNHDWSRALSEAWYMAADDVRKGDPVDERAVMWVLLKEAAQVSKLAYAPPPRTELPRKSAMPEAPDEISYWQRTAAYLRGELDEMPSDRPQPPRPSAYQISRAEAVLEVWHKHALARKGDRSRMKRALYLKACGVKDRKVRAVTGMTRQAISAAKTEAMRDMWDAVKRLAEPSRRFG